MLNDADIMGLMTDALLHADPDKVEGLSTFRFDQSLADLGVESIALLEMAGYVEERLGITFPDDELALVGSVDDFRQLINRYAP